MKECNITVIKMKKINIGANVKYIRTQKGISQTALSLAIQDTNSRHSLYGRDMHKQQTFQIVFIINFEIPNICVFDRMTYLVFEKQKNFL